jgi:hypothetical protein
MLKSDLNEMLQCLLERRVRFLDLVEIEKLTAPAKNG